MSLAFDEYGRPFIIIRDQAQKQRLKGLEAQKVRYFEKFRKTTFLSFFFFNFQNLYSLSLSTSHYTFKMLDTYVFVCVERERERDF